MMNGFTIYDVSITLPEFYVFKFLNCQTITQAVIISILNSYHLSQLFRYQELF